MSNATSNEAEKEAEQDSPDPQTQAAEEVIERLAAGEELVDVYDFPEGYLDFAEYLAHQAYQRNDFERAERLLQGVIAVDSQRHYPYLLVGRYHLEEQQDFDQAIEYLSKALEMGPDEPATSYSLAEALFRDDQLDRAVEFLRKTVIDADENNPYGQRAGVLLDRIEGIEA